jgi:hypothetical protein
MNGVAAAVAGLVAFASTALFAQPMERRVGGEPQRFANGFPSDATFFPIAVWLQQTSRAPAYRAIGINTFVALSQPPTPADLARLQRQGLFLIAEQVPAALAFKQSQVIRAWMHIDEPDNAQALPGGGHGECISPEDLLRRYDEMRSLDPTRPVYLGFGQAVANPRWFGRGPKCSAVAPEEYYARASRAANIVAFDIYPVAEFRQPHVTSRLDLVGRGVANLKRWAPAGTPVWADIETTHINHPTRRPLPEEIYNEVWIAIINGAQGITYFVHEWKPSFREDGVLRYPDTVDELGRINAQIASLAPVLNSATVSSTVSVDAPVEIATMVKRQGGETYLFAINMERRAAEAKLALAGVGAIHALVLGEDRTVELKGGIIVDRFGAYTVHIYKISTP